VPEITEVTVPGEEVESGGAPPAAAPGAPASFDAICGETEGDYTGTTAITDALTAGHTRLGITPGTYDVTGTTNYPENLVLYGLGTRDSVVLDGQDLTTYRRFHSNTRIENLTFKDIITEFTEYTENYYVNNIVIDNKTSARYTMRSNNQDVYNIIIRNSHIKRGAGFSIAGCGIVTIDNCLFENISSQSSFYASANATFNFTNNRAVNCHSIEFSYWVDPYDAYFNVHNNTMQSNIDLKTWAASTTYQLGDKVVPTVSNSYYYKVIAVTGTKKSGESEPPWPTTVDDTVVDNEVTFQLIAEEDLVNYGFNLFEVSGDFVNNRFINVWGCEIQGGKDLKFNGNTMVATTNVGSGITVEGSTRPVINSSFSGNIIRSLAPEASYSAIDFSCQTLDSCVISNNIIENCYRGIGFFKFANNCTITGNTIDECKTGILDNYQMQDCVISNNTVTTTDGVDSDAGISSASTSSSSNIITGNSIEGPFLYGIYNKSIKSSINMNSIKGVRATTGYGIYHTNSSATNMDFSFNRIDGAPGGSELVEDSVTAQKVNNLIY